jgi:hypothetical protein
LPLLLQPPKLNKSPTPPQLPRPKLLLLLILIRQHRRPRLQQRRRS